MQDQQAAQKITFASLNIKEAIGEGGFGVVYRAKHSKFGDVAYKQFKCTGITQDDPVRNDLMREIGMMNLDHPNISRMFAYTFEPLHYGIVLEFMTLGGLDRLIVKEKFTHQFKRSLLSNIAAGMNYLHSRQPPVIHSDLKLANVLVTSYYVAKLSDFGLSRWKEKTTSHTAALAPGTASYIAPEHWRDIHCTRSTATDVYAFGILIWALMSESVLVYKEALDIVQIMARVIDGDRPDMNLVNDVPKKLQDLMTSCWSQKREDRPSFEQIRTFLGRPTLEFTDKIVLTMHRRFYHALRICALSS